MICERRKFKSVPIDLTQYIHILLVLNFIVVNLYIYKGVDVVEWSRALDVRLSEWCCSVSMVWVQIPSREEQKLFGLIFRRANPVEGRTKIIWNTIFVLLTCGKHLHGPIISPREEAWLHIFSPRGRVRHIQLV